MTSNSKPYQHPPRLHRTQMTRDFAEWDNNPPRTPHEAPSEVRRAYEREARRYKFWRRVVLALAFLIGIVSAVWAITTRQT